MTRYYFLGIAGTAMASVAVELRRWGHPVTGSDNGAFPPMSDVLSNAGVPFHSSYRSEHITDFLLEARGDVLVIMGNAVSRGNPEVEEALNRRLPFTSLAAFVGERLIGSRQSIVISGTHGKTTSTALIAWTLECAGASPGFLVGGVPGNFNTGCQLGANGPFVIEGDEYDTAFFDKRSKFVHYRPGIAVINNVEFDHADIFDSLDAVKESFRQFVNLVPGNGCIVVNGDDANAMDVIKGAHSEFETFGFGEQNDWRAAQIAISDAGTTFLLSGKDTRRTMSLPLVGAHNVRNALAAIAVCVRFGLSLVEIQRGFSSFNGVRRRMEIIAETGGITVIDDFAHHPTAIASALDAVRAKYPSRRVWALFEPRSNTSTRSIFQNELAEALSRADRIVIGALNRPERYRLEERLSVERLCLDLTEKGRIATHVPEPMDLVKHVVFEARRGDVIVFLSNGNFGGARQELVTRLSRSRGVGKFRKYM